MRFSQYPKPTRYSAKVVTALTQLPEVWPFSSSKNPATIWVLVTATIMPPFGLTV